jgi:hypothetical protein
MKITVNKIVAAQQPYHGTSKSSGKPYTIYAYTVDGTVDGAPGQYTVKTMDDSTANLIQAGGAFDADASVYNGQTSYMVKKPFAPRAPQAGGKPGWQPRPTYSPATWAAFAADMWRLANALSPENAGDIFGFLLGAGAQHVDLGAYATSGGAKPSDKVES